MEHIAQGQDEEKHRGEVVVGEGDAPDEEPGHQLGQIADENEQGDGGGLLEGPAGKPAQHQVEDQAGRDEQQTEQPGLGIGLSVKDAGDPGGGGSGPQPGHQEEGQLGPQGAEGLGGAHEHGGQTAPAHHRVEEGGKAGGNAAYRVVHIVQDGPGVDQPLIPAGGVGMGSGNALVVGEHILLVLPHLFQQVLQGQVPGGRCIGQVGQHVDDGGDDGKDQHREGQDLYRPAQTLVAALLRPAAQLDHQTDEVEGHQTGTAVNHRPLGGGADAPEQPRQEEGQGALLEGGAVRQGEIPVHEVVHQQDEEEGVGVDGGQPGLGQMHEVHRQQDGAAGGDGGAAKDILQKQIEQRNHSHPEEGAHKPPAEGGHAKEGNANAHDQLAQRGMGDLVGFNVPQMLIGGAGMIDLVKVGGVLKGDGLRYGVRLVKEGIGAVADPDTRPALVKEGQLVQLQQAFIGLSCNPDIANILGVIECDLIPFEQLVVILSHGVAGAVAGAVGPVVARDLIGVVGVVLPLPQGQPVHAVGGDLYLVLAGAQTGKIPQLGDQVFLRKNKGGLLLVAEIPGVLGGGGGAQVEKGGNGVGDGDEHHGDGVLFHQGVAATGEGEGLFLRHGGDLLGQRSPHGLPVPQEEAQQGGYGQDGEEVYDVSNGTHRSTSLIGVKNKRTSMVYSSSYFISSSCVCQRKISRCPPDWLEFRPWLRHRHAAPPSVRGSGW